MFNVLQTVILSIPALLLNPASDHVTSSTMSHVSARSLPLAQSSLFSLSSHSDLCLLPHSKKKRLPCVFHVCPTPHILIDFPELHYKVHRQQLAINVHLCFLAVSDLLRCLTVFM